MKNTEAESKDSEMENQTDSFEELGWESQAEPDFWSEDSDASFEFADGNQDEVSEGSDDDQPSENQIGLLLSAISSSAEPPAEPMNQSESVEQPEEVSTPNAAEPAPSSTFTTIENDGDAAAIQELAKDPELRDAYLDDALKCLSAMEQAALTVENESGNKEAIQQFCRELHTLKGASASVGLSELATYLHELESSLDALFQNEQSQVDTEPMFAAVDRVRAEIEVLTGPQEASSSEPAANAGRSQDFSSFGSNDDSSIRIRAAKLDRLMDMLAELVVLRNRRESHVCDFNELNDELTRCATRLRFAEEQGDFLGQGHSSGGRFPVRNGSQTVSEIGKDITAVAQGLGELQTPVSQDNQSISRFIRDFRQELMQLRRVPISGLFNRLQRAVRDAAQAEGKQVQLEILGEGTGLEQEIQERLYEPLLHIVRNAVSHGIETPQQRTAAGKNATGIVTVQAHSNVQRLVIEIRDNGGGIDYAAVRNRAIDKGLIARHQMLTEAELGKLIFHPGFSTREQASEVSGRGVGMDIVATTIEQLRGRVDVESELGFGTTMRISIPLRTGIEHVMVFRSTGQLFALPMQSVKAVNSESACRRVSLNEVLSLTHEKVSRSEDLLILRATQRNANNSKLMPSLGLAVDEIVGPEEVVVRGLPASLQNHPLFCGVTLSGGGETVLLLDGQRVEEFCNAHESALNDGEGQRELISENTDNQQRALVVDDSLTARKVLVKKLQAIGIATIEAGDGMEALDRLRREQFDYVFTDLDMPRLGGLELLSDIQSQKYTDAPVIVVSSRGADEFQAKATELGAMAYLSKPVQQEPFSRLMEGLQLQVQNSDS